MRPYVEPKIEQVKETVTPYVNRGVETYEQIKEFKDAKTTQIKDFTDRQTSTIKEFTDAKATQIKNFTDPQVVKIKGVVEPQLVARKIQAQKLLRVAGCADLQDLKYESLLGKVASSLTNVEAILDKYLPVPIERRDSDSDSSTESDSSYTKINKSLHGIKARLSLAIMIKINIVLSIPAQLKTAYSDGTLKKKVVSFYTNFKGLVNSNVEFMHDEIYTVVQIFTPGSFHFDQTAEAKSTGESLLKNVSGKVAPVAAKLAPAVSAVTQNSYFKKAVQASIDGSEKTLGKEKTAAIVQKVKSCIPSVWTAHVAPKIEVAADPVRKHK